MIDVRAAMDEVRVQAEDEAYWNALEKVLGRVTARTLRATLRANHGDRALTERQRVSRRFSELLAVPSRFVEDFAKAEASAKTPHPRDDALRDLGLHEHWIDFSEPSEQAARTVPFVERGLARGAKVVALLPTEVVDEYRKVLERAGLEGDLESGRLAILAADQHADILLAIQGFLLDARGQGYEEVWFVSKIASTLLSPRPPYVDRVLRSEAALDGFVRSFPTSVFCPFPAMLPGDRAAFLNLIHTSTWASVADAALDLRSMSQ